MNETEIISARAISRILSNAGFKRANAQSLAWSSGFEVHGFNILVRVFYNDVDSGQAHQKRQEIIDTINGRADKKYWATFDTMSGGTEVVMVYPYDETHPRQNEARKAEAMEQAAEESPEAVTLVEIREVLSPRCYAYTDQGPQGSGYSIERDSELGGMVRISYKDHPYTTYAPEIEGGREGYAVNAVERYATMLQDAGYTTIVDHDEDHGWSCLVGPKAQQAEDEETATQAALNALREAVEKRDPAFLTRKAGPWSLFVYYLVPFKDKVRRLEVSWMSGEYRSSGRFGGARVVKTSKADKIVDFCVAELRD